MTESLTVVRDCFLVFAAGAFVYLVIAGTAALQEWLKERKRWRLIAQAIAWVEAHGCQWGSEQKLLAAIERVLERVGVHVDEDEVEHVLQWMKARGELVERKKAAGQRQG